MRRGAAEVRCNWEKQHSCDCSRNLLCACFFGFPVDLVQRCFFAKRRKYRGFRGFSCLPGFTLKFLFGEPTKRETLVFGASVRSCKLKIMKTVHTPPHSCTEARVSRTGLDVIPPHPPPPHPCTEAKRETLDSLDVSRITPPVSTRPTASRKQQETQTQKTQRRKQPTCTPKTDMEKPWITLNADRSPNQTAMCEKT